MRALQIPIAVAVAAAVLLAGCGGEKKAAAPPGSAANPLPAHEQPARGEQSARLNEANGKPQPQATVTPNYQALVKRQTTKPRARFTPCNLVTRSQAQTIIGGPVQAPLEAPQGPTCIYRSRSGTDFITVAMHAGSFKALTRPLREPHWLAIAGREAVCGDLGRPTLFVRISGSRALGIAAPCDTARKFAAAAVERLPG